MVIRAIAIETSEMTASRTYSMLNFNSGRDIVKQYIFYVFVSATLVKYHGQLPSDQGLQDLLDGCACTFYTRTWKATESFCIWNFFKVEWRQNCILMALFLRFPGSSQWWKCPKEKKRKETDTLDNFVFPECLFSPTFSFLPLPIHLLLFHHPTFAFHLSPSLSCTPLILPVDLPSRLLPSFVFTQGWALSSSPDCPQWQHASLCTTAPVSAEIWGTLCCISSQQGSLKVQFKLYYSLYCWFDFVELFETKN